MPRCSTPDTLIGVGGGGSKVVYRFMQQRWILDEVLEDRTDVNGEIADELHAITIDSAVDEGWHGEKASAVEETIKQAIDDSNTRPMDGYLEFEGPKIVPDMIPREWEGNNLTSPGAIRNLANDNNNNLSSWWMKSGREPISSVNRSGFNGGVHRLRSLSKALYHISEYTDQDLLPNQIDGNEVCLVAALGGGTGSGMILDLATNLSNKGANVNLFGILPHGEAGGREKTNAHAALSELEYAELNNESPFESITLIPHIKEIEDDDREFEMAAVRTILAHQQMSGSDQYLELLPNDDDPARAPAFAPFSIAVPNTVRYNFKVIEQAEGLVDKVLTEKRKELQKEADLYEVVETYLKDAFPETAKPVLENHTQYTMEFRDGDGLQEALSLKQRIEEDVLGTLLSQQALEVAGLEDTIAEIQDEFEPLLREDEMHIPEDAHTLNQAAAYVDQVPDNLLSPLKSFDLTDADGRPYELVEAVKQEFENIQTRRNIWKAVSEIDSDVGGLKEIDAKLIRRGLLDVTLDDEKKLLGGTINNPTIKDRVIELRDEYEQLTEDKSHIESFWVEVCNYLRETRNRWYSESIEDAKRLAAIKADRDDVTDAINDLSGIVGDRVESVSRAEQIAEVEQIQLNLESIGPLGEDDQIAGVGPLNQKLKDMGIDEISVGDIEDRFDDVKEAKLLKLKHGDGFFGPDNSEEFPPTAVDAEQGNWFVINKGSDVFDIKHEFEAEFVEESIKREFEIDQVEDDGLDNIVSALEDVFIGSGSFESFNHEGLSVPKGTTPTKIKQKLRSDLEESDKTSGDKLLDDVLPINGIVPNDVSIESISDSNDDATASVLFGAYLRPICNHYNEHIVDRLDEIGSEGEKTSLINRLEKIRGLAEGPDGVSVTPPKKYKHEPGTETYGQRYANEYKGIYELPLDDNLDYRNEDNPYLTDESTDPGQMSGNPDHIGETNIIENEEIELDFRAAIQNLFKNSHGQAPFNNLKLKGTGMRSDGSAYPYLRVRQVYLSRAFETKTAMGKKYDKVYDIFEENVSRVNEHDDVYKADQYAHGWEDDVSMVSFIGGIFLDNISLVTQRNGYLENYQHARGENSFIGSHHTIGMGGRWETWKTLSAWAEDLVDGDHSVGTYGAYVFRDETRAIEDEFVEDIKNAHETQNMDAVDIFNDMLTAETYDSSIDLS